jgi:hypothetical protein
MATTIGPLESGQVPALESMFLEETGILVRLISAGSWQALQIAREGRVDSVLTHAPQLESSVKNAVVLLVSGDPETWAVTLLTLRVSGTATLSSIVGMALPPEASAMALGPRVLFPVCCLGYPPTRCHKTTC